MPTYLREDKKPVVQFDARLELSPFALFRRLTKDRAPLLIDIQAGGARWTLQGAESHPEGDWSPSTIDQEAVVFDADGTAAVRLAGRLQAEGYTHVRALFGGLELWQFALDPKVVGDETFLVEIGSENEPPRGETPNL
ncbi:MAG: hypothetical protein OES47_01670 [Acidobacteriota bacterium]|nr:hypothetical protein [Acidobacteriota bacterium]